MFDLLRLFLAITLFLLGVYLTVDLFISGFSFVILISAILFFVLAHYIKPKNCTYDEFSSVFDFIDIIIDIPFKMIAGSLRLISKPFRSDVGGIDL